MVVAEILGLDVLFAQMVLAIGVALVLGNGFAWWKHRRGEAPEGADVTTFRAGRVAFLMVVGILMTFWGAISVLR